MTNKKDSTAHAADDLHATETGPTSVHREHEDASEENGSLRPEPPLNPPSAAAAAARVFEMPNTPGPFMTVKDLSSLRLSQDFTATGGVKMTAQVPVRKAADQVYFRAHGEHRFETRALFLKEESEWYLVASELWDELAADLVNVALILCVTRQGTVFIWPARLADDTGKMNPWHQSALQASVLAVSTWVRLKANQQLGGYDVFAARNNTGEPVWPSESFHQLIDIAFRDKFIERLDHPVLRRIRGEI